VNLPENASTSEVADTYWHAWELGLKGVTVYRYGSRERQVLELGTGEAAYHYDHASRCDPTECRV
jgi:ribonucleoside-diphosphate reductase alpha chain